MIRSSSVAAPRRLPVLWAKALVLSLVVTAVSLVAMAVCLLAFGAGALLRHTAGALTAVLGLLLVIDNVVLLVPLRFFQETSPFLPSAAGRRVLFDNEILASLDAVATCTILSPWQGYAVLLGWIALLLGTAAVLLRRKDA